MAEDESGFKPKEVPFAETAKGKLFKQYLDGKAKKYGITDEDRADIYQQAAKGRLTYEDLSLVAPQKANVYGRYS